MHTSNIFQDKEYKISFTLSKLAKSHYFMQQRCVKLSIYIWKEILLFNKITSQTFFQVLH